MSDRMSEYVYIININIYVIYIYVPNIYYVRIMWQGGDHSKKVIEYDQ